MSEYLIHFTGYMRIMYLERAICLLYSYENFGDNNTGGEADGHEDNSEDNSEDYSGR